MSPPRAAAGLGAEAASKARMEGPGMSGPLAAALRPLGLAVRSWAHLRSHHRPGAGFTALYRVEAVPRSGADGSTGNPLVLQIGATTASLTAAQGAMTAAGTVEGTEMRLWVHPRDPVLESLPWATNAQAVARDLFGADRAGARASLRLAAYRPLRRAVIHAGFEGAGAFLKVPQPRLAAGLRQRLELTAAAGLPVPPLLPMATDADPASEGVLALGVLSGRSVHQQLSSVPSAGFDPETLIELLAGLPAAAVLFPRKQAWSERVLDYAAGACIAFPAQADRITRCAREVHAAVQAADPGPVVPAHGDFHGGNLLAVVGHGSIRISGLLDLDALGPGHRVDDLACFLGHLQVLAALHPRRTGLLLSARRCAAAFAAVTDPAALYARSAAVVLSLVSGAAGRGSTAAQQTLAAAEHFLVQSRRCS